MRILNIILGSADASPNMILLKDDIYFRITNLSVCYGYIESCKKYSLKWRRGRLKAM